MYEVSIKFILIINFMILAVPRVDFLVWPQQVKSVKIWLFCHSFGRFWSGFGYTFWPLPRPFKARPERQEDFAPPESGIKPDIFSGFLIGHTNNAITFL